MNLHCASEPISFMLQTTRTEVCIPLHLPFYLRYTINQRLKKHVEVLCVFFFFFFLKEFHSWFRREIRRTEDAFFGKSSLMKQKFLFLTPPFTIFCSKCVLLSLILIHFKKKYKWMRYLLLGKMFHFFWFRCYMHSCSIGFKTVCFHF